MASAGIGGGEGSQELEISRTMSVQSGFNPVFRLVYFLLYDSTREHHIHRWVVLLPRAGHLNRAGHVRKRLVLFGGQGIPRRGGGANAGMESLEESIDCGIRFAVCI